MRVLKKIFKAIGILILVLLGLILLGLICTSIYHRIRLKSNKEFLAEHGYYNPVSVGDRSLNLVSYGGNEDGHRIIALSGNGGGFPIELQPLADLLKEDNQVYYLARAGYDGSDDTDEEMTISFVIEDYRKALQNAGVEAPYVLMPHSYAGLLATYWVSKYPDEIEGMIDLDGLIAQTLTAEQKQEAEAEAAGGGMGFIRTMIHLGIGDIALPAFFPPDENYSEDEQRMSDALTLMTMGSKAFESEITNAAENMETVRSEMEPNDVPKLYINAKKDVISHSLEELKKNEELSEERINVLTPDFTGTDEERREKAYELQWAETERYLNEQWNPYFEKLGSCEIVNIFGGHWVHASEPEACAEVIRDFLAKL